MAAIVLLAAGLGALTALTYAKVGSGFTSIANQDAPLVEESTGLYFALTDMDGQVANVLLTSNDPTLAADQQDLTSYAADRQHAEHDLQQVTVTAAANPRAQQAIAQVLDALGRYEALAAEALTMNARGNDTNGRPSAIVLGLVTLGALGVTQVFLARRYRRLVTQRSRRRPW